MQEQLVYLTKQLYEYNQKFLVYYNEVRGTKEQKPFFEFVKPFADEVAKVTGDWKTLMKAWLIENETSHIHLHQLESVSEHLERLAIQAFFPETRRSRFLNAQRTVEYFLTETINQLKK
ncbi:DUF1798 family protein [Neobacillus sp. SM06]|uniref:DUF1798 family protein n=1 Tax=Neobacillus sp. SM06 TaxID=3422492 RepID=UPI003D2A24A5